MGIPNTQLLQHISEFGKWQSMLRIVSCVFAARVAGFRAPRSSFARASAVRAAPAAADHGVCAVFSKNARGVSAAAIREAEAALGKDHVFATATLEEAAAAARTIRSRGYETVIAGGGDGTLGALLGDLCEAYGGGDAALRDLPAVAALPLGTGNAVARYVCGRRYRRWAGPRGVARACARLRGARPGTVDVPVLRLDSGELCFIAGQGFDAFLLDDYARLKAWARRTPLARPLYSVAGYFVAMALRTLPAFASGRRRMNVRVESPAARWVDPRRGDAALPVAARGPLYEGDATIVAGGATPFYGGGLRLFPFARAAPGALHLRVARMSPWRFVPNVLGIFRGTYRHETQALDFVGDEFTVTLLDDTSYPFQQSGDAMGARPAWRVRVAGDVKFVDLLGLPEPLQHLDLGYGG